MVLVDWLHPCICGSTTAFPNAHDVLTPTWWPQLHTSPVSVIHTQCRLAQDIATTALPCMGRMAAWQLQPHPVSNPSLPIIKSRIHFFVLSQFDHKNLLELLVRGGSFDETVNLPKRPQYQTTHPTLIYPYITQLLAGEAGFMKTLSSHSHCGSQTISLAPPKHSHALPFRSPLICPYLGPLHMHTPHHIPYVHPIPYPSCTPSGPIHLRTHTPPCTPDNPHLLHAPHPSYMHGTSCYSHARPMRTKGSTKHTLPMRLRYIHLGVHHPAQLPMPTFKASTRRGVGLALESEVPYPSCAHSEGWEAKAQMFGCCIEYKCNATCIILSTLCKDVRVTLAVGCQAWAARHSCFIDSDVIGCVSALQYNTVRRH